MEEETPITLHSWQKVDVFSLLFLHPEAAPSSCASTACSAQVRKPPEQQPALLAKAVKALIRYQQGKE